MVKSFISFDSFITPTVIKFIYYVLLVVVAVSGVVQIVVALSMLGSSFIQALGMLIAAVVGTFLGIVFVRVGVEGVIAFFQIHDALVHGKTKSGGQRL
ncbi:DUF4282 domain-containing protein [Roseospira navarrensis]|uniref:DUF4282 domain-containing protein n=1 Tax=Roseospira navarrensis TaxID=140058 RepID=A0A7X1ZB93_9PROT|nr:DUF4282 domain-containing protein [Roseospira navarrensis]MQX35208.1 DUF4282 domain-containing protein [Roseospira navarrensis]